MNDFSPERSPAIDDDKSRFSATKKNGGDVSVGKPNLRIAESSEETIRRVLCNYDIGPKLRQLRLRKKIALVDLGKHTGLSASMLSQLENGKLIPTLPTLVRIAMVFDVGLDFFFGEKRSKRMFAITRAADRIRFPEHPDSPVPGYFFEVLSYDAMEKSLSAYLAEFPITEPDSIRQHYHEGAEFVLILEGTLAIHYQGEDHVLNTGDSVYFDGSEAHSYKGLSASAAKAIVITSPPRL